MLGFILHLIKIMPISDGMYYAEPLSALAIAGLAMGGLKSLGGLGQMLFPGKKVKEPEPYQIPEELKTKLSRAYQAEQTGMPEVSRMQARQGAEQAALFGMRAAQDRRAGLAMIGQNQAILGKAYTDIASRDAAIRMQNFMQTQNVLSEMSNARNLKYQTDYMRYQNKEQQRRANIGAGMQNVFGGLDFAGSMAAMGLLGGGGLGTGSAPGFGGSTYNPMSQFLSGSIPGINYRSSLGITSPTYNLSPSSLSLYRGPQAFNSNILRGR
jgi:hypothetical protein